MWTGCICVNEVVASTCDDLEYEIRVITKLPNSEQSYKGKVKTHKYISRQNQSTTGKLWIYRDIMKLSGLDIDNNIKST